MSIPMSFAGIEEVLGYTFTDRSCLWEALNAPGSDSSSAGSRQFPDGHKRLALKGDAAMKYIIIEDWFSTDLPRGKVVAP